MKIIFLGSSEFSIPSFVRLIDEGHEMLALVCQPDKPCGRGNKVEFSEIKKIAIANNIPVLQFGKIRTEGVEILKNLNPELMVVASYGQILSQEIIDIASKGIINVHASLLPKYRGASPIATAILNGDKTTGVTIMRVEKGVDTGNMILKKEVEIKENETTGELSKRLASVGAEILIQAIKQIQSGNIQEQKQDEEQATFTKMISKEDAELDFNKTAHEVFNKIRAFNPSPIVFFEYKDEKIKVYESEIYEASGKVGEILLSSAKQGLVIACKENAVKILKLQAPNGKILDYKSFLNGKTFEIGYQIK